MGGGKGAAGCDQDMRTYSARPRRIAKPQAIRANGATRGADHVDSRHEERTTARVGHRVQNAKTVGATAGNYASGEESGA